MLYILYIHIYITNYIYIYIYIYIYVQKLNNVSLHVKYSIIIQT